MICSDEIWLTPLNDFSWQIEFKAKKFKIHEMEDYYEVSLLNEQGELLYIHLALTFTAALETLKEHFK